MQAWDGVKLDRVTNCFKHCGFQTATEETTDPFADLDEDDGDSENSEETEGGGLDGVVRQIDPEMSVTM